MGIPKLYSLLAPYSSHLSLSSPSQTPLFIDGPALAYHLYNALYDSSSSALVPYSALISCVDTYLSALTRSGFRIQKIYFDGGLPTSKADTRASRLTNSLAKLSSFRRSHANISSPAYTSPFTPYRASPPRSQPLPALPFIVLATLTALLDSQYRELTFTVPGEADCFLARDATPDSLILTSDSDLLVFKSSGWGVMMFRDLTLSPDTSSARVFYSAKIEERLGEELQAIAFHLLADPTASLGTIKDRIVRARERTRAGAAGDEESRKWKREFSVPAGHISGMTPMEPRLAELVGLGTGRDKRVMYMPVIWEDVTRSSAWEVGVNVRAAAYASGSVGEIRRKGGRIVEILVDGKPLDVGENPVDIVIDDICATGSCPAKREMIAVAACLTGRRKERGERHGKRYSASWERVQLWAMVQAGWYSLYMLKEVRGGELDLPPVERALDWEAFMDMMESGAESVEPEVERIALEAIERRRQRELVEVLTEGEAQSVGGDFNENGKREGEEGDIQEERKWQDVTSKRKKKKKSGSEKDNVPIRTDGENVFAILAVE